MKKTLFILSLVFAGFTGFAADLSGKPLNADAGKKSPVKEIVRPVFECCSTASMSLPNGNVVSCTACAATCSGPQGSEAKAADCLMDLMLP